VEQPGTSVGLIRLGEEGSLWYGARNSRHNLGTKYSCPCSHSLLPIPDPKKGTHLWKFVFINTNSLTVERERKRKSIRPEFNTTAEELREIPGQEKLSQ